MIGPGASSISSHLFFQRRVKRSRSTVNDRNNENMTMFTEALFLLFPLWRTELLYVVKRELIGVNAQGTTKKNTKKKKIPCAHTVGTTIAHRQRVENLIVDQTTTVELGRELDNLSTDQQDKLRGVDYVNPPAPPCSYALKLSTTILFS